MRTENLKPYGLKGNIVRHNQNTYVISGMCDFVSQYYNSDKSLRAIRFPESQGSIMVGKPFEGLVVKKIIELTDTFEDQRKGIHNYVIIVDTTHANKNDRKKEN